MWGMRQLAASQDAAAFGPAASVTASTTCLAIAALYRAMYKAPPGAPRASFKGGTMYGALVRAPAFSTALLL